MSRGEGVFCFCFFCSFSLHRAHEHEGGSGDDALLSLTLTHLGLSPLFSNLQTQTRSRVIILVKAGAPVDGTISGLLEAGLEPGDVIIDGGNEWYENTERRSAEVAKKGVRYIGMGVSGGEEGARNGPSMMPGGDKGAFDALEPVLTKVAAQVDDGKLEKNELFFSSSGRGRGKNFDEEKKNSKTFSSKNNPKKSENTFKVPAPCTSAPAEQGTSSRWSTTGSSTATCS